MNPIVVVGMMSGTSLDGMDLALCHFSKHHEKWHYTILDAFTYPYTDEWRDRLSGAHLLNPFDFIKLHKEYGILIGNNIRHFLKDKINTVNLIASHGHTIFHQPKQGVTFQLGDGVTIAVSTNIITITDFRSTDVALGGQGAPLVPVGDRLLFEEFDACINLGGFSNISFTKEDRAEAFDICPVNIAINYLMKEKLMMFDKDGMYGKKGKINQSLLEKLNSLKYYQEVYPKSLGREWFEDQFIPLINESDLTLEDKLRTVYEHIAIQIYLILSRIKPSKTLFTGGGTFNSFLIELIRKYIDPYTQIQIPDNKTIEYKEALIFALLGVLRYRNEINCLASVTGARRNNSGGVIHHP